METTVPKPIQLPKQGAALFRWILEERKLDDKQVVELTESQQRTIEALRKENAERGTTIVSV
jgi:hypothetical protein